MLDESRFFFCHCSGLNAHLSPKQKKMGDCKHFALRGSMVGVTTASFALYRAASSRAEEELNEVHNKLFREAVTVSAYVTFFAFVFAACVVFTVAKCIGWPLKNCTESLCDVKKCKDHRYMGWIWWVQALFLVAGYIVIFYLATYVVPPHLVDYIAVTWIGLESVVVLASAVGWTACGTKSNRFIRLKREDKSEGDSAQDRREAVLGIQKYAVVKNEDESEDESAQGRREAAVSIRKYFTVSALAVYGLLTLTHVILATADGPNFLFATYFVGGDELERGARDMTVVVVSVLVHALACQLAHYTIPSGESPIRGKNVVRALSWLAFSWSTIWIVLGVLRDAFEVSVGNW